MGLGNLAMTARLDRLILAIGEERFGDVLADTLRAVGEVDHVLAFALSKRKPRCLVNAGGLDAKNAALAVEAYARKPDLFDIPMSALTDDHDGHALWFGLDAAEPWAQTVREDLLDPCCISDLFAFVVQQDNVSYLIQLICTEGRRFGSSQRWMLEQVGEVIAANIRKHFSYIHAIEGQNQFLIARVLVEAPLFQAITPRERLVCIGILTGHTSESIAMNLQISINSVLTYRKRLYEKLGISSQNELFVRVIDALMALSSGQPATDRSSSSLLDTEAARARMNGRPLGADLAFAQAFFG